jgi:murein DD-endopeptidase MepM/ murein hydrolase activator NlpD
MTVDFDENTRNISVTTVTGASVMTLVNGEDFYIGPDERAHFKDGGTLPPGEERPTPASAPQQQAPSSGQADTRNVASDQEDEKPNFIWPLTLNGDDIKVSCEYLDTVYHPNVHRGTDISAPEGTAIHAIADGTILFVVSGKVAGIDKIGRGNYVIINHGNGYRAIYQHNITNNVVPGDKVFQGDVIAFVGNTGRSLGNHLHLEIMEGVPESTNAKFEDYADNFEDTKYHKKDPREYLPQTNY